MTYEELMPDMLTPLLWGTLDSLGTPEVWPRVDQVVYRCSDAPPHVRQVVLPWSRKGDPTIWAPLPEPRDPRWILYAPALPGFPGRYPAKDQEVLCWGPYWDQPEKTHCWFQAPVGDPLAFPGFAGGPHTRDWGVKCWMPLEDVFKGKCFAVPKWLLNQITPEEYCRRNRVEATAAAAVNIALSIINEGPLYQNVWHPICTGHPELIRGPSGRLWAKWATQDKLVHWRRIWKDGGRANKWYQLVLWCACQVIPAEDRNANIWFDAVAKACEEVLDHYARHACEFSNFNVDAIYAEQV